MNRCTVAAILEVANSNPNGDPDNDGAPRTIGNGFGLISAVSIKRKLRDVAGIPAVAESITKKFGIPAARLKILESEDRGEVGKTPAEAVECVKQNCRRDGDNALAEFFDARVVGDMVLFDSKKGGKKKPNGDGAEPTEAKGENRFGIKGCVSISDGMSIAPVEINMYSITKAHTWQLHGNPDAGENTLAPQAVKAVQHGLYYIQMSAINLDKRCFATPEDLQAFRWLLPMIWDLTRSCTRPAGSLRWRHIWWLEHDTPLGTFNEYDFWDGLRPVRNSDPMAPSRSIDDYSIPGPDNLPKGMNMNVVDLLKKT